MHALVGRVRIKPGCESETLAMIAAHGVAMVRGIEGSVCGYWARQEPDDEGVVQHTFWLFDNETSARHAEQTFLGLRDMPDAPATFIAADVCEVVGQA